MRNRQMKLLIAKVENSASQNIYLLYCWSLIVTGAKFSWYSYVFAIAFRETISQCPAVWLTVSLTKWLTEWLTEWLTDWLTSNWLTDRLTDRPTVWLSDSLTVHLALWISDWLTDCISDWHSVCLYVWLTGWLTVCIKKGVLKKCWCSIVKGNETFRE